ncbi:unnamed protein product [Coffea canephora]|uniref:ABC-2 type transporter transmembrane domain-containing protein n=1 Tax=Coffea canephora TaxID=49390 RepID=A0A068V3Y8_COFCA|nr:unnamed protein product [Coffea canephora]
MGDNSKQYWSHWRSPSYNLIRFLHIFTVSVIFGVLFWNQGQKMDNQQSLFNVFGATYTAVFFCGVNNCASVSPYVSTERVVLFLYRERFAGMYTSWSLCTCSANPKMVDLAILNGMITSQYGDIQKEIEVFGETKTIAAFLRDYYGFHHGQLPLVPFISILYPLTFAFVFAF